MKKISTKDYLTASGKYPDRESHPEVNLKNAELLLESVNSFLDELSLLELIPKTFIISSGFRPSSVKAKIQNAAKKSLHLQCLAIDVQDDKSQSLAKACMKHPELLRKYGLFLESPDYTKNWVHLDKSPTRSDRKSRVFIP